MNRLQDQQVLELLQWCQSTLDEVFNSAKTAQPSRKFSKNFSKYQTLSTEEMRSNHLQLVLKQISLLLETLA